MLILVSCRFVIKDSLCVLICCKSCVCHISSLGLSHTRSSESCHVFTSTVTALLKLSDARTLERYAVVSAPFSPPFRYWKRDPGVCLTWSCLVTYFMAANVGSPRDLGGLKRNVQLSSLGLFLSWRGKDLDFCRVAGSPWAPEISSLGFSLRSGQHHMGGLKISLKNNKFRAPFDQKCPLL